MLWILLALLLFISQIAVVIVNEHCRPQKTVAWLAILFVFPLIGFLAYVFVAKEYSCIHPVNREDDERLERLKERLAERCERRLPIHPADRLVYPDDGLGAMLKNEHALPVTACNETTVYIEGKPAFAAMLESISLAKHHIHIEFYIVRDDILGVRLQQLLIRKAREGVEVRLLYDGIGSRQLGKAYLERLREAGVKTGCFAPPLFALKNKRINFRNHRKIVVVDGKVGFFGGLNIGDEYLGNESQFGYWRDTHFKLDGDAVLWIQYTFASDWYSVKGEPLAAPEYYPVQESPGNEFVQIVKSGPDETILELIFSFAVTARKRIYIETPYFVPDPGIMLALKTAAMRGVDVRVIIPEKPDYKLVYLATLSYVRELLQAGIRFYRYRKGFIHAKVVISDDVACSGSANMDMRSFTGQFEMNAVFFDGMTVKRLIRDFHRDLGECEEIRSEEFEKQPKLQNAKEIFARLLSPLF